MNKKDAIIILGGGINSDNSLPLISRVRAEKAIELFNRHVADNIVVSGAFGFLNTTKATKTEASVIRDFLISKGIPEKSIFMEEKSKDTIGNAYFVKKEILEIKNWHNIVVVTSEYHLPRTEYCFNKVLGSTYQSEFIGIDSGLDQEEMAKRISRENEIINFLKKIASDIEDGDLDSIERILYAKHPAYSNNAEFSKEDLTELIK